MDVIVVEEIYIIECKNGGDERKEINRDPQVPVT